MPINSVYFNQSNLNSALTCIEGAFNLIGYAPAPGRLAVIKQHIADIRLAFGGSMAGVALTTSIISLGVGLAMPQHSRFCQDLAKRSVEYIGHGLLNMARSRLEAYNGGALTLAYDIYNQKLLPYTNVKPQFDIQSRVFVFIKTQIGRIDISNLIPAAKDKIVETIRSFF